MVLRVPRGLIRQGDLLLVPVAELPERVERVRRGRLVLAEGEATGHAHVVDDERASAASRIAGPRRGICGWSATSRCSSSTRSTTRCAVSPGVYEVRRQREYAPRGGSGG